MSTHLPYAIAAELKEARFPRNGIIDDMLNPSLGDLLWRDAGDRIRCKRLLLESDVVRIPVQEWVYAPTLSELIEACGLNLRILQRVENSDGWVAITHDEVVDIADGESTTNTIYEGGNTPEEAVAKLWLYLKRKPV